MALMVYSGAWGKLIREKKAEIENLVALSLNTQYLTRFRTCKIARPPETKTWERRGPHTDKHLPQSPFTGQIFR
jgi:hypothetical protein